MPLLWGRTRCTEVAGWQDRIITKLTVAGDLAQACNLPPLLAASRLPPAASRRAAQPPWSPPVNSPAEASECFSALAGGVGAVVGGLLSVVQQQPALRLTAISTASFLMLTGCFSGVLLIVPVLFVAWRSPRRSSTADTVSGTQFLASWQLQRWLAHRLIHCVVRAWLAGLQWCKRRAAWFTAATAPQTACWQARQRGPCCTNHTVRRRWRRQRRRVRAACSAGEQLHCGWSSSSLGGSSLLFLLPCPPACPRPPPTAAHRTYPPSRACPRRCAFLCGRPGGRPGSGDLRRPGWWGAPCVGPIERGRRAAAHADCAGLAGPAAWLAGAAAAAARGGGGGGRGGAAGRRGADGAAALVAPLPAPAKGVGPWRGMGLAGIVQLLCTHVPGWHESVPWPSVPLRCLTLCTVRRMRPSLRCCS